MPIKQDSGSMMIIRNVLDLGILRCAANAVEHHDDGADEIAEDGNTDKRPGEEMTHGCRLDENLGCGSGRQIAKRMDAGQ